jgi:hypothetical protein
VNPVTSLRCIFLSPDWFLPDGLFSWRAREAEQDAGAKTRVAEGVIRKDPFTCADPYSHGGPPALLPQPRSEPYMGESVRIVAGFPPEGLLTFGRARWLNPWASIPDGNYFQLDDKG